MVRGWPRLTTVTVETSPLRSKCPQSPGLSVSACLQKLGPRVKFSYLDLLMRMLRAIVIVVAVSHLCFAQTSSEVRVRVLDYRTGLPVKGWKVGLSIGNHWIVEKTMQDGVASFRTATALPQNLHIDAEGGVRSEWSCIATPEIFDTSVVLEKGLIGNFLIHPLCKHHVSPITKSNPGEVVVYVRRLDPWLTFRRLWHDATRG